MIEGDAQAAWRPLSVDEAATVFGALGVRWWVAGGWAIDLFLGEQTRDHADIDLAILRGAASALRRLGREFELFIAHDGRLTAWDGRALAEAEHQFWARRRGDDAWAFEVLLERHAGERWVYRRDARITLPLDAFGVVTERGVPCVRPEVALLYKSNRTDIERNAADFARAAPALSDGPRGWLREALGRGDSMHRWIEAL